MILLLTRGKSFAKRLNIHNLDLVKDGFWDSTKGSNQLKRILEKIIDYASTGNNFSHLFDEYLVCKLKILMDEAKKIIQKSKRQTKLEEFHNKID